MRLLVPLIISLPALAGCLAGVDDGAPAEQASPEVSPAQRADEAPPIDWNLTAGVDWWEYYATEFPKHDSNTPENERARLHIVAEMEAAGFDVEVRDYPASPRGQTVPGSEDDLRYHAVIATWPGTELPNNRIGLVSHYDTQAATVHGAYDDSSGVAASYEICKALSKLELRRTIACLFFDAEEQGLRGSQAYVNDTIEEGDEDFVYDFVVGYDMVGINWPGHEWKMYVMTGDDEKALFLAPFAQELMNVVLAYPEEGVEVLDVHDRNSDEMNFKRAGVPIFRLAGGRDAADYPGYHQPFDTVEFVYQYVDGRPNFEAGFNTIVESSYSLIYALDKTDMAELTDYYG